MKAIPFYFIGVSTIFALLGMAFGIYMSAIENHMLAGAHAHNNLLGWVTMAIFGLYYARVSVAVTGLAVVHFWVTLVANLLFPVGIALAILGQSPVLAGIGGGLEVISMLIFAYTVWVHRAALSA